MKKEFVSLAMLATAAMVPPEQVEAGFRVVPTCAGIEDIVNDFSEVFSSKSPYEYIGSSYSGTESVLVFRKKDSEVNNNSVLTLYGLDFGYAHQYFGNDHFWGLLENKFPAKDFKDLHDFARQAINKGYQHKIQQDFKGCHVS